MENVEQEKGYGIFKAKKLRLQLSVRKNDQIRSELVMRQLLIW